MSAHLQFAAPPARSGELGRPRPSPLASRHSLRRTAFTLVELLVVMAIIGAIVALVTPAMSSLLASGNLARAGQVVGDQINMARQTAAAHNAPVEIRLFKTSNSADGFGAVQLWMNDDAGTAVPFNKLVYLPSTFVVAANTSLSGAFAQSPTPLPKATTGSLKDAPYASFQVRPTGVVAPVLDMNTFFMTVVPDRDATNTSLPENYVTLQINPLTATPLVYRP